MDKARNRKLMQRLARQMDQAALTATRYHQNNPHTDLKRAVKATTERAARRFAKREMRPIFLRKQLREETDRIHLEASQRAKGGGCFDTRGNQIPCPVNYRSYEAITSIKKAIFDDLGQFIREENVTPIAAKNVTGTKSGGFWDFGTGASLLGDVATFGKEFTYNDDFWVGKNGKFNNSNWGGNKYTGGKFKFAKKFSKLFGKTSKVLGLYSIKATEEALERGEITKGRRDTDQVVNGIGFAGTYGAAFNFGFNLGYVIEDACDCNIQINPRYFNAKYIKRHGWRFDKFFEDPDKPYKSVFE